MDISEIEEGEMYEVRVDAKDPHGAGIGKIKGIVVFINNTKTRIGKVYRVKITKVHRTFAYAEPISDNKYFIGNGSLII